MGNNKEDLKQRYDNFAEPLCGDAQKINSLYSSVSPVQKYFRRRKVETAIALGKYKRGDKVLEVGSNVGQYTTLFAEKGFSMTGIDLSDKAVEVARAAARSLGLDNIDYLPMDAENLSSLKDGTFHGVVSFSTLRYVPDLKKALKEIYRVTKADGTVVLDFPNKHCPWFTILKNKFRVENHIHDHFYSAKELESLFRDAGFSGIETKKIMFTHYTFNPKFLKLYETMDRFFENTPLIKEMAAIILCKGVKK